MTRRMHFTLLACLLILLQFSKTINSAARSKVVELSASNITSALKQWDKDLAIMFYSPRCKYCKQLASSMESIASLTNNEKDLVVSKFNCEIPAKNTDLCVQFGIDYYPSIFFVGYGDFNQAPKGNIVGKKKNPRVVHFNSDLYPEAIYDWVLMLSGISKMQRKWDDMKSIFTGKSRAQVKAEVLATENAVLSRKVTLFADELEKYKADDLFRRLTDNGDPFPLMASLEPDDKNLPLRYCVGEMAEEFCKYHSEVEKYCRIVDQCVTQNMEPEACRPAKCPFNNPLGCTVVSQCMNTDVIEQYKEALAPSLKAKAGKAAKSSSSSSSSYSSSSSSGSPAWSSFFGSSGKGASGGGSQGGATGGGSQVSSGSQGGLSPKSSSSSSTATSSDEAQAQAAATGSGTGAGTGAAGGASQTFSDFFDSDDDDEEEGSLAGLGNALFGDA